jgi:ribosomal protein S24E
MENLETYTNDLRKMLTKALVRRKNLHTYARHVAPGDPDKERVKKNLAKHAIEIDVLNVHIEAMQEELKVLKAQLAEKGVNFTLAGAAPMQPKKAVYRSTGTANGKTSFTLADQVSEEEAEGKTPEEIEQIAADRAMVKAFKFIADLMHRGYKFHGKKGKSPVVRNGDFHGVQWCDTPEGKLFFYTTRRDVFRCYSSDKR